MNDRIKELMLEAGYAAPELDGRANKLAELLIKECCSILTNNHPVDHKLSDTQFYMNMGRWKGVSDIKRNFNQ